MTVIFQKMFFKSMLSWMKVDMSDLLLECRRFLHWNGRQGVCWVERQVVQQRCRVDTRQREKSWTEMVKVKLGRLRPGGWRAGRIMDGSRSWKPTITLIFLHSFFPPLVDWRGFLGTFLAMPRWDRRAISWGERTEGGGVAAVSRDRRSCRV